MPYSITLMLQKYVIWMILNGIYFGL